MQAATAEKQIIPTVAVDEDGFLIDPQQWTPELAEIFADEPIGFLTEDHWQAINYIRQHYFRLQAVPLMRRVCKELGFEREQVKGLFGSCQQLWRIAGLPNPGEEAKTYMS